MGRDIRFYEIAIKILSASLVGPRGFLCNSRRVDERVQIDLYPVLVPADRKVLRNDEISYKVGAIKEFPGVSGILLADFTNRHPSGFVQANPCTAYNSCRTLGTGKGSCRSWNLHETAGTISFGKEITDRK